MPAAKFYLLPAFIIVFLKFRIETDMTGFKGTLLSMTRNYRRSLSLFVIFVIVFTVLTGSFLIKSAAARTIEIVVSGTNLSLNIDGDFSSINNLANTENNNGDFTNETEIMLGLLEELKKDRRITNLDYRLTKRLTKGNVATASDNWNYGQKADNLVPKFIPQIMAALKEGTANEFFTDPANKDIVEGYMCMGNLNDNLILSGETTTYLKDLASLKIALQLNKRQDPATKSFFTEENLANGDFVCIMPEGSKAYDRNKDKSANERSRMFNVLNNTSKNGTAYFTDFYVKDGEIVHVNTYEFKVVGYYYQRSRDKNPFSLPQNDYGFAEAVNTYVYVPETTLMKIHEQQKELMKQYDCEVFTAEWSEGYRFIDSRNMAQSFATFSKPLFISNIKVDVMNSEDLFDITAFVRDYCKDIKSLKITNSTEDFDRIAGPIKTLDEVGGIVLYISVIFAIAVISLIVILQIRDRSREIGILMSLGQSRKKIIISIIREILIIGTAALLLAMFIGNKVGRQVSDYVIKKFTFRTISSRFYSFSTNQVINRFHIQLDGRNIGGICLLSYLVMSVSSMVAGILITRVNPKEVLLKNS